MKFHSLFLMLLILFAGCTPVTEQPPEQETPEEDNPQQSLIASIVTEEKFQEVSFHSGNLTISLKSNVTVSVEIPSDVSWVHFVSVKDMETRQIVLMVDENNTDAVREATVYLVGSASDIRQPYKIIQDYKPVAETEEFYSVGPEGGNIVIKLSTNMDHYTVSVPDEASSWLTFVTTKAMHTDLLTFSVAATNLYATRQASVSILSSSGTVIKQFIIKQNAKAISNNEIWYTTKYGYPIEISSAGFNSNLKENVYSEGYGRMIFDDDILVIPQDAFKGQSSLISVTLPNSVTTIQSGAFQDCTSMTDLYLSTHLASVEADAFANYGGTIHFNGEKLPDKCCAGATRLTALDLGNIVETIGDYAFDGCSSLSYIVFPESLKSIGRYGFRNCTSLTGISLPNVPLTIGEYAFYGSGLKEFTWYGRNLSVRPYAFSNSSLEKVTFVEEEGEYAYTIAEGTFESTKLKEIEISDHVTAIGSAAFKKTPMENVVIGKNLLTIGDDAFNSCPVQNIELTAMKPPKVGSKAFTSYYIRVSVPQGTELDYVTADTWKELLWSSTVLAINGFNDFLSYNSQFLFEPYAVFSLATNVTESFPLEIASIGLMADYDENNMTLDKASFIKEVPTSNEQIRVEEPVGPIQYRFTTPVSGLRPGEEIFFMCAFARFKNDERVWYSRIGSVVRYEWSMSKSASLLPGAANCHIVKPGSSVVFPATVGNTDIPVVAVSARVLWDSGSAIQTVIYEPDKTVTGYPTMTVFAGQKPGNAVVVAQNEIGDIVWSWHIWVTDADLEASKQTYRNVPHYVMDRNLGALSAAVSSPEAVGLAYQWGRKDPFMAMDQGSFETEDVSPATGSVGYTVQHPAVLLVRSDNPKDWVLKPKSAPVRWSAVKGIYDPCPSGWRVPERSMWAAAIRTREDRYQWNPSLGGVDLQEAFMTRVPCWYPFNRGSDTGFLLWGSMSENRNGEVFSDYIMGSSSGLSISATNRLTDLGAVRCVSEGWINGSHEGTDEEDWGL